MPYEARSATFDAVDGTEALGGRGQLIECSYHLFLVWHRDRQPDEPQHPHGLGRGSKKVAPAVPVLGLLDIHQPHIRLVNQPSRLKRLAGLLLHHFLGGQLSQFSVDERQHLFSRLAVTFLDLLAAPNIASRAPVYGRYDHMVGTNTVVQPGGDAAVLRIKGTGRGVAVSTDGNGRLCFLEPREGGRIAVAEAARNVSCVGAEPIAITNFYAVEDGKRQQDSIRIVLRPPRVVTV